MLVHAHEPPAAPARLINQIEHVARRPREPVELHVDMPGRSKSVRVEWINRIEDESRICWGMDLGHPSLLVANRFQELTKIDEERTRYYTVDKFSGLVVPLMMALYGEPTRLGFESVARGLKTRAEALYEARR